jgi:hypothetical protein
MTLDAPGGGNAALNATLSASPASPSFRIVATRFATKRGITGHNRTGRKANRDRQFCRIYRTQPYSAELDRTAFVELQNRCSTAELTRHFNRMSFLGLAAQMLAPRGAGFKPATNKPIAGFHRHNPKTSPSPRLSWKRARIKATCHNFGDLAPYNLWENTFVRSEG